MTVDAWLQAAIADAEKRGLSELKPVLQTLARSLQALRDGDFNQSPVVSRQTSDISDRSSDDSRPS
jgi:hypothetical protein